MEAKKIEAIKKYLSFYDAKYYDVQAELIDHFATAIEKYQRENPELNFRDAFKKAHQAFGGKKGIWKYLDGIERDVRKKTNRMLFSLMLQFMHWPYTILTALIVLGWYFLFLNIAVDPDYIYFFSIIVGAIMVWGINAYRLKDVKMYMPRQANRSLGLILYLAIFLPGNHLIAFNDYPSHILLVTYFSLMTFIFVSILRLPDLAIKETLKLYPEIA
ncbi:hypothetical protein Oweho_2561 [Owenweeksia hongkongensis DSM 17368]|uniref:Uncharacterized protein n=1 Tax=Owenweeksia hongkongensis (strain DSM 17368 / CIP 108786 / JCM 12287 / NRRL B-23963 / UST20020801) TaxID=926562 RepID=G8R8D6_OWEHD|nr:hypothetical protein [Owenweeksia hongkongensis]AEV33529.1 hypothetical protein Oweho_2561 [Owenweeksia hongkongensis DSM 17368]